jgi:hypothetical protein
MKKTLQDYRTRDTNRDKLIIEASGPGIKYTYETPIKESWWELEPEYQELLINEWILKYVPGVNKWSWYINF